MWHANAIRAVCTQAACLQWHSARTASSFLLVTRVCSSVVTCLAVHAQHSVIEGATAVIGSWHLASCVVVDTHVTLHTGACDKYNQALVVWIAGFARCDEVMPGLGRLVFWIINQGLASVHQRGLPHLHAGSRVQVGEVPV